VAVAVGTRVAVAVGASVGVSVGRAVLVAVGGGATVSVGGGGGGSVSVAAGVATGKQPVRAPVIKITSKPSRIALKPGSVLTGKRKGRLVIVGDAPGLD
jgi:hypothetical protein